MAAITLRDVPDDLQEFLRQEAVSNHRSLNKQAIAVFDDYRRRKLAAATLGRNAEQKIARMREIQRAVQRDLAPDARTDEGILGYDEQGLPT